MNIMDKKSLQKGITRLKLHATKYREAIQALLLSAAFYAFKDGNVEPFNQILDALGNETHKKGITRWVELVAGIGYIKNERFKLRTKAFEEAGVTDEATFEPYYTEMAKVMWCDAAPKQVAESVFDEGAYMKTVQTRLIKNGWAGLAEALKQAELNYLVKLAAEERDLETETTGETETA